jgi:uncharacterized membrane protein HdeD (DUF308 family)
MDIAFLALLGNAFGSYGIRELVRAYRTESLKEWGERALFGTAGVMLGAVFVILAVRLPI